MALQGAPLPGLRRHLRVLLQCEGGRHPVTWPGRHQARGCQLDVCCLVRQAVLLPGLHTRGQVGSALPPAPCRTLQLVDMQGQLLAGTLPASWGDSSAFVGLTELQLDGNRLAGKGGGMLARHTRLSGCLHDCNGPCKAVVCRFFASRVGQRGCLPSPSCHPPERQRAVRPAAPQLRQGWRAAFTQHHVRMRCGRAAQLALLVCAACPPHSWG